MTGVKLLLRSVDDFLKTVKGDPSLVMHAAKKLNPNLQFTLETPNENGDFPFLDININVDGNMQVECGWYQKPTETGTLLNFRSCAPLQRNIIEGTVHRILRSTSITWEHYIMQC